MTQVAIPAVSMRGGTSKAIVFDRRDLPERQEDWAPIFLAAIGSPDPNGRQLDGMGGGVSSLSKVCVVGPSGRADADVEHTFAQIAVREGVVDFAGTCGNMSSAIGPFALDQGLVPAPAGPEASVRIHDVNTGKIIVARFPTAHGKAVVEGSFVLDGVAGAGAPVRLEFVEPGGATTGRLLPTGNAVDVLRTESDEVEASLVDAANPFVFVAAAALGLRGTELPDAFDAAPDLLHRLEQIRRRAAVAMGLASDPGAAVPSIPKIALVAGPADAPTLSGRTLRADEADLLVRMMSVGQPHRAIAATGGLCVAVACRVPGSIPNRLLARREDGGDELRIGHPSGIVNVAAAVGERDGQPHARYAAVYRSARRLFQGEALVPAAAWPARSSQAAAGGTSVA
jgi:2-methylaconitate cis-trans-isomerase PrpF